MPLTSLPARAVRAVLRRVPRRVRHLVPVTTRRRLLGRTTPARRAARPVLSVVIPVYNVEEYLRQCLDSVLAQTLEDIEILIVDDGSTDGCPQIEEEYAAAHPRITLFRQANSGQGAARNLAVSHARGRFLTFLDADDTIPRDAYEHMVRTLRRSGSDFCVGSVRRVTNGRSKPAPWPAAVHERDRLGITIEDFPDVMQDVIACNRMFRRRFWVEKVGGFRGGIAYEDHVPMVVAYIRATRFDVLAKVTYWWRIRENQTSTGQQKHQLQNLLDRIEVKAEAEGIVKAEGSPVVLDAWLGRVLDTDFPPFVNHALRGDDEYRSALAAAYRRYLDLASPAALRHVRVQQKVRGWLASRGRWAELEAAQRFFAEHGAVPPTRVVDGRIYADVPVRHELDPDMGDEMLELGALESAFGGALQRAVWLDDDTLELTGWAFIKGLDLTGTVPQTRARLVDSTTGAVVQLPVEPLVLPDATRWSGNLHANYDTAGFRTRIRMRDLAAGGVPAESRWRLLLTVAARGLEREGSLHHSVDGGSASRAALRGGRSQDPVHGGPVQVVPLFDAALGFAVVVRPIQVLAETLEVTPGGRTVTGRLTWDVAGLGEAAKVRAIERGGQRRVDGVVVTDETRGCRFSLNLPVVVRDDGTAIRSEWDLKLVTTAGASRPVHWPSAQAAAATGPRGVDRVAWRRSPRGYARLVADSPLLQVREVTVDQDVIRVRLVADGLDRAELDTLTLSNTRMDVPAHSLDHSADGVTASFPTHVGRFGLPPCPLPPGPYWLQVTDSQGVHSVAAMAAELLPRLPLDTETPIFNTRVWMSSNAAAHARISVSAPLRADERGNWAQRRLRTWHQTAELTPEHAVLFQCYRGEVATDSQRALHQGLTQRGSDLTLYWGVSSHATWVPDGGVKLLIGSAEWYEKLGRAEFLCNNVDFDGFFRKRPYQRYLQTFHGYPFKSMGRTFWAGKGFTPDRIALENERRNAEWNAILVPSQMCEPMYRTEYDYDGKVLVTGYPRTDALVDRAPGARERVLRQLGVDPGKTVVLYAPTFRDALTTANFAAKRFDGLDLERLTDSLGEDHVVLLRGHNNNMREPERMRGRARVLDVTDHPEINDLTLAADVAVLDYSSLRFDWALTGKPMVFFVPDLTEYFAFRPPLFDFQASAPGPLLSTTDEVVGALTDLDAVRTGWGDALSAFNATYNELHDGKATDRVLDAFFSPAAVDHG